MNTISIEDIRARTDCRELVAADLGQPKYGHGKCHTWLCPFHSDGKTPNLKVRVDGWKCFACGEHGDCFSWLMKYHGLDFRSACEALGVENDGKWRRRARPEKRLRSAAPPALNWQESVNAIVALAENQLWSADGQRALTWLRDRGLTDDTIQTAQLGYIPGHYRAWNNLFGIAVPCGIAIPWIAEGAIWGIKVRRAKGKPKYEQIAGGNLAGALYGVDHVVPGKAVLFTEGEFDCLIAWQDAGDLVSPVTLGAASNALDPRWYAYLACASNLLSCYDADESGNLGSKRLAALTSRVKEVKVPSGKDVNEYHLNHGLDFVRAWITEIIPPIKAIPVQVVEDFPADEPTESEFVDVAAPLFQEQQLFAIPDLEKPMQPIQLSITSVSVEQSPSAPCPDCGAVEWKRKAFSGHYCLNCIRIAESQINHATHLDEE